MSKKKWIYECDYTILNKTNNEVKNSPIHEYVTKEEVVESISDDIQKYNGEYWYRIKKEWIKLNDLCVFCHRRKYDISHNLVKEDKIIQHSR